MPTDDAAGRVAQIRERWALGYYQLRLEEVDALLAALTAAEAERDKVAWNYARALEREVGERELRVELEQRATRLAALEAAARHLVACDRGDGVHAADWEQFEAAVAALAAAEAERDRLAHELADERRKMHVYGPDNQVTHCGCRLCGERQAQGSRLAALETAARAWALVFMDAPAQEPWWSAWEALHAAVHALDDPPEEAPAVAHTHCYCTLVQRTGEPRAHMACCQCGDERDIPRREMRVYLDRDEDGAPSG